MEQIISELLERDHEQLAKLLDELQSALTKPDPAYAFELLDLFWARLAVHIRAENVCLFPAILEAAELRIAASMPTIDEAKSAIERLRSDHNFFMDQLSQTIKTMRALISGNEEPTQFASRFAEIRDRVTAVSARLVVHNELEEEQVYKWPDLILSRPKLESLNTAIKRELKNLPPRFAQP